MMLITPEAAELLVLLYHCVRKPVSQSEHLGHFTESLHDIDYVRNCTVHMIYIEMPSKLFLELTHVTFIRPNSSLFSCHLTTTCFRTNIPCSDHSIKCHKSSNVKILKVQQPTCSCVFKFYLIVLC